jgi:hypothetical protein
MQWILVSIGVACLSVMAVMGLAAVVRGWTPRLGRPVLRPRLWGTGVLLSAFGLGVFMFLGPLGSARPGQHSYVPLAGMATNFVGLGLQTLARRTDRVPPLPTKSAS